ncbi:O-antigen ligase family protein [Shewanella mangrovisoli]|uniref:O-antigen ligase family protein n=1 Tax=Shewanella mangrovisoli TaxID=2864211 RepID=A0ABV4VK81_9GAMM
MDTQTYTPENSDERLVWLAITGTYFFWFLGAMYLVAPVIGWILVLRMLGRLLFYAEGCRISLPIVSWIFAMLLMLLALVIGHLVEHLGIAQLIKSSIGWAKGWALLAVFPLIGGLQIRPQLIYRACCVVGKHTLILFPLFVLAWLLHLPTTLYVSPLSIVGGPGPEFFAVSLYEIDPGSGMPRWRLFTPWAPALGMVGNFYFLFALQETNKRYRFYGLAGSILMVLISQSRLAILCCLALVCYFNFIRYAKSPWLYLLVSPVFLLAGIFGESVLSSIEASIHSVKAARADSTRVREALGQIALERWANEAIVWGHGIVERGPHMVEYMPIGSHHTWYGLLFVKGIVGAFALAVALFVSVLSLLPSLMQSRLSAVGMAVLMILLLYTFGENLEILAYLFWPGLIVLGIAHNQAKKAASLRHKSLLQGPSQQPSQQSSEATQPSAD